MSRGLQFRNVDLHVHTPASRCFIEPDVTPQDIVAQAIEVGMKAIAITDHNSAKWIDRIKEAARDTPLTVFPGTEITVQPGIHVIAIFPTDRTSEHVNDLLATLDLRTDQRGDSTALVTRYGIQEVIAIIRDHHALPVLAHIDAVKGAWQELGGQTRVNLWQAAEFAAVEIVGESLPDAIGRSPFNHQPAYYWASDNPHPDHPSKHSHRGIGTRYSRFKLDEPITWEGLRQCFADPEVRIRRGQPALDQAMTHPVIERVQIDGGFLDGLKVELNPNLNGIIGGRGTGKSTLLEIIRHAFDIPAKTQVNVRQAQSILESVFPIGSRVTVDFELADNTKDRNEQTSAAYRVERLSGHPPQVFRAGDDTPLRIAPVDLLPLQVYGQKEIYEISQNPEFQLRLLDNYVAEALKPLQEKERWILRRLRAHADEILRLEETIAVSQEWLARLGAIEEELRRMETVGFEARVRQKEQYERERRLLDLAQSQIDDLGADLDALAQKQRLNVDELADDIVTGLPHRDLLRAQRALLQAVNETLVHGISLLQTQIADRWAEGHAARADWQAAYGQQEKDYREMLGELHAAEQSLNPDRYIQLQQRKQELKARDREVQQQKIRIAELTAERQELKQQLRNVRRRQYETRRDKAIELTEALKVDKKTRKGSIRITLHPAGYRKAYKDYMRDLFAGLNVRNPRRDALAEIEAGEPERQAQHPVQIGGETRYLAPKIPRYLDPIDLAETIRAEQEREDEADSLLEQRFKVDSDTMRRNMTSLSHRQLFELELFAVPDLPIIELQVGSGQLGYRRLDQLSVGQKCTALLSVVLLESPAPLLIDQPEDDLDNQFIFDQIATTLRREKERRQFIIATHNANIPVSGDAELTIVLQADGKHGQVAPDGIGPIDAQPIKDFMEQILEGSQEAFCLRKEKYGIE